jgi:hypothetical protein
MNDLIGAAYAGSILNLSARRRAVIKTCAREAAEIADSLALANFPPDQRLKDCLTRIGRLRAALEEAP